MKVDYSDTNRMCSHYFNSLPLTLVNCQDDSDTEDDSDAEDDSDTGDDSGAKEEPQEGPLHIKSALEDPGMIVVAV